MEATLQKQPDLMKIQAEDLKEIERIKLVVSQPNDDNWVHPQPLFEQIGTETS